MAYKCSEEIEKVQIAFCKQYVRLKQNTMDSFVLVECGRYSMAVFLYDPVYKILD